MKRQIEVLLTASLVCIVTGALAQSSEGQISAPPPPPQLQSAPAEGDAAFFYETLQPHGSWVQVSPFGPVWRPHIAVKDTSWRPYCSGGKWIWSKNAWYWESEYEWGWAPFHYGRWIMSSHLGWVWVPGREWSAAWVNWSQTSTHYGWAPMPPERSVYIGMSTTDSGITWGFQFGLTDSHYIYEPCNRFHRTVYVRDYNHNHGYYDYNRRHDYDHRNDGHVVEVPRQSTSARITEPSRRTTVMQQVVTRSTPSTSSSVRPLQQAVTRSTPSSSSRVQSSAPATRSSTSAAGSSSGSRASRIAGIAARSKK